MLCLKIARRVTNSLDPDEMLHPAASQLGLHCLLRHVWPQWFNWMRRPTGDQEVTGSTPTSGQQHSFVEIDHEIYSTVILSRPLTQEKQLSVSGERMCTILVNRLED